MHGEDHLFRLNSASSKGIHGGGGAAKGSNLQGFFTFFKSMFGAGILVLTHKFTEVGMQLGLLTFLAVAIFVIATTYMLLDCHIHCSAIANYELKSFEDIAGFILGKYGRRTIRYCIALLQLLFCTGFMIVFCDNMQDVFPALSRVEYAGLALFPLTLLSWIPSMKDMWLVSVLGLAVYLLGVVGLSLYDGARHYKQPDDLLDWKIEGVASFFGVCCYAIEGICLVIPTSTTLRRREDSMGVITFSLVLYTIITLSFAAFTFAAGLGSCDSIVECLEDGFMTTGVRLALCGALVLTHPVFIIVVADIVEGRLFPPVRTSLLQVEEVLTGNSKREVGCGSSGFAFSNVFDLSPRSLRSKLVRFVLVSITLGIAASGIKFSIFSGLVGSVLTSFVGFVMPAVMWWQMYHVVGSSDRTNPTDRNDSTTPLLSPQHHGNSTSAATGGPKSSLFTLLSPSSSRGGSNQQPIFNNPITPTGSMTEDSARDWVYSSFIPETEAAPDGSTTKTDLVLVPPPLLKFYSGNNLGSNTLGSNSADDSSVDSKEFVSGKSNKKRPSWFGRLFTATSGSHSQFNGAVADETFQRSGGRPDSRNASTASGTFLIDSLAQEYIGGDTQSSYKTRDSIYEYEEELMREPSGNVQRYYLPPLTIWGHMLALFFVVVGIVAMIAGGVDGMQELVKG